MIKKTTYIIISIFVFFLFKSTPANAKEYCHIYVNEEFKETLELPFYIYEISMQVEIENSWPKITYKSNYFLINSLTLCEEINIKVHNSNESLTGTNTVYDYTKNIYDNYTDEEIFLNANLNEKNSIIKGYSSIIDEEAPIIEGYKDYYITNIDNPIDFSLIFQNISAYDKRDGNITEHIKIEHNEYDNNTDKIGTYPIILSVEDSSYNKASITIHIEIIDTTPPIIEGKQNYSSYLSSPLNTQQIKNELSAYDNVEKDISSKLYICEDHYSQNINKVGTYSIYFCIYDSFNNLAAPYKVEIEIIDDIPPIIEGLDYYTSYLSNPLSAQEILHSLAASDNHEDISNGIFISKDTYSSYQNTTGEKHIIFQVMDYSNNISPPFKVTINLIDNVKPQIFGLNTYTSNLSNSLSLTYLKQQLTVLDNIDGNISSTLEVIDDTYSTNINKIGTYYITFQAKDSSNNLSESFKINITNIDDVTPTITGPSELKYSIDNKPTLSNILTEFTATDNVDNNLEIVVEKENYSNSITTGTYYITLSCTDNSKNKSLLYNTKIEIVDILVNLNELSLSLPTNKQFSIEEINKIINLNEPYKIIINTYSPNYSSIGSYTIEYELQNYQKIILTISTYELKENTSPIQKSQKKETFFQKIKSFLIKILNYIKRFLKSLFS